MGPAFSGRWAKRWVLVAMTAGLTMVFLDQTAVSVALPSVERDLGATHTQAAWVMNAFLVPLAALAALAGRLGDRVGRRSLLLTGVGIFLAGSLVCALAPTIVVLIVARALQGIGAAAMTSTTAAILADTFDGEERARSLGIYIAVASVFLSVGPLVGGALSEFAGWRWIFVLNVPIGAATFVLTARHVTQPPRTGEGRPIIGDWPGAVALVAGTTLLVVPLMEGTEWGWSSVPTIGLLLAGCALLSSLPTLEKRRDEPLLDMSLLRNRDFSGTAAAVFASRFAAVGVLVLSAIYLQDLLGLSPVVAGLAMLPATLPFVVIGAPGGKLTRRLGGRRVMSASTLVMGAALIFGGLVVSLASYTAIWPVLVGFGTGLALATVAASVTSMDVAGWSVRGEASGLLVSVRQLGGTVGLAAMTALFTVGQRGHGRSAGIEHGMEYALLLAAGVCLLGSVATWLLMSGRRSGQVPGGRSVLSGEASAA